MHATAADRVWASARSEMGEDGFAPLAVTGQARRAPRRAQGAAGALRGRRRDVALDVPRLDEFDVRARPHAEPRPGDVFDLRRYGAGAVHTWRPSPRGELRTMAYGYTTGRDRSRQIYDREPVAGIAYERVAGGGDRNSIGSRGWHETARVYGMNPMRKNLSAGVPVRAPRRRCPGAPWIDAVLERQFWLLAIVETIRAQSRDEHAPLTEHIARRIHATFRIAPRERAEAVRFIVDRVVPFHCWLRASARRPRTPPLHPEADLTIDLRNAGPPSAGASSGSVTGPILAKSIRPPFSIGRCLTSAGSPGSAA